MSWPCGARLRKRNVVGCLYSVPSRLSSALSSPASRRALARGFATMPLSEPNRERVAGRAREACMIAVPTELFQELAHKTDSKIVLVICDGLGGLPHPDTR